MNDSIQFDGQYGYASICSPESRNRDTARNSSLLRGSSGTNHPEKELAEAQRDLAESKSTKVAESKKVLRVAKKKAKAAKGGKFERKQTKRILKSIKAGVELVEERCDNLHEQVEERESGTCTKH